MESARPVEHQRTESPLALIAIATIGIALVLYNLPDLARSRTYSILLLALIVLGHVVFYKHTKTNQTASLAFCFSIAYSAFHFGFLPLFSLTAYPTDPSTRLLTAWYLRSDQVQVAHGISLAFLGALWLSVSVKNEVQLTIVNRQISMTDEAKLHTVSTAVLAIAALAHFTLTMSTGARDYYDFTTNPRLRSIGGYFGWLTSFISCSLTVAVITGPIGRAIVVFSVWGVWAFLFGFRGEVAFPALMAMGLLLTTGKIQLRALPIFIVSTAFLVISSIVAETRLSMSAREGTYLEAALRGITELGGSLRPVFEVVDWVSHLEGLRWGETYYAPLERTLASLIPLIPKMDGSQDMRLTNVLIDSRIGPYGFSIAAEAYYNFGIVGAMLLGSLVGMTLRLTGRAILGRQVDVILISLTAGAFIHIRQSYVTAYGAVITSAILLIAIAFFVLGRPHWKFRMP